jgi:hypothetical protein
MSDRIEEIFDQVMNESCPDPLRRFAELVRQDERNKFVKFLMDLHEDYKGDHNYYHFAANLFKEQA